MPAAAERSPVVLASLDTGIFVLQSCRKLNSIVLGTLLPIRHDWVLLVPGAS